MEKRIIVFAASLKGYTVIKNAVENGFGKELGTVVSFEETNVEHSYDKDIKKLCLENDIEYCRWKDIRENVERFFSAGGFYTAVLISWKFLLPLSLNKYLDCGMIVFHDSLLPRYRGFAPTPTAIINGEEKIGVTVLFASDEADNGDIILQKSMEIKKDQYIYEIIEKQSEIYSDLFNRLMDKINKGEELTGTGQNEEEATYSIWRGPEDCQIDWGKNADEIYDFVRAVGRPYPGAYTFYGDSKIIIDRTEVTEDKRFEIREEGKIWKITDNEPEVICKTGMIRIKEAHYENGDRVVFKYLRKRLHSC